MLRGHLSSTELGVEMGTFIAAKRNKWKDKNIIA
jgi:hypothetical protein